MYDDEIKVPATKLPDGWSWSMFDDGSGGLYSPQGKGVASYDLSPYHQEGGIEYKIHGGWSVFWGGFDEFTEYVETTIAAELEKKNMIQPTDSQGKESINPLKSYKTAELVVTYEELMGIADANRITYYFGDLGGHFFKDGITEEQILSAYEEALEAIEMDSDTFQKSPEFIHRGGIIDRMMEKADPGLTMEL